MQDLKDFVIKQEEVKLISLRGIFDFISHNFERTLTNRKKYTTTLNSYS